MVEIGTGGSPGNAHCDIDALLASETERENYLKKLSDKGLTISAFSCHHNPISPNKAKQGREMNYFVRRFN